MKEGGQFGVAAPACHLRALEAEAGGSVSLRSAWAPERNPILKANTKEEHMKREELGKWRLESKLVLPQKGNDNLLCLLV